VALNIIEFAKMLSDRSLCEVRGFQSFLERPDEKQKMEAILSEHGTALEMERFLAGELDPQGLVIAYLNPEQEEVTLYEMNATISENWQRRA
jgi:hypothetical protein